MADEKTETREEHVPDPPPWATLPRPGSDGRRRPVVALREADFPLALRGYDRAAVDEYVEEVTRVVGQLESARMRAPAVRRALEEVGEQTSEILRQAHETADEIAARSRAQAEGRIQRAEREAAAIREDAEEAARRLEADTAELWEQRRQLLDDLRTMAQDAIAVVDMALERLPDPQGASRSSDQPPSGEGE